MSKISLRTFLREPGLCGIEPGLPCDSVRNLLGEPEDYSAGYPLDRAPIWKISDVELHFDLRSDSVWSVYADDPRAISALDAGLAYGMAINRVEAELSRRGYSHARTDSEALEGACELRLASGVRLLFDSSLDEASSVPRLHGFTYGPREKA